MAYELIQFADGDELAKRAAADWWKELLARKAGDAPPYLVGLSGGRITKTFYEEIVRQVQASRDGRTKLFENVHFFWADERCVPLDDAESNYALAKELLFEPLKIPDAQIHRVRTELSEAAGLDEVTGELRELRPFAAGGQPEFDLVFLGMGEDGHTASLFPGEPEGVIKDTAVYRAVTAVKPPPRRITLGYGALVAARQAWVLISGGGKDGALKKTLSSGGITPLGRVIGARTNTKLYTDVKIPA